MDYIHEIKPQYKKIIMLIYNPNGYLMGITPMRYFVEGIAPDQLSQRYYMLITISRQGDIRFISLRFLYEEGRQGRRQTENKHLNNLQ